MNTPSGPWNPRCNGEVFEPRELDPGTQPMECLLYRWFAGLVAQMQADFAKEPVNEIREWAVHIWRLVLNCLGPLAAEARGKDYADHFYRLGDEMRQLATHGETPPWVFATIEKQLKMGSPMPRALPSLLTGRRRSVLILVSRGCSDTEIAKMLNIGKATCAMHIRHLLCYFRARNRTQLVRRAMEEAVLNLNEEDDILILDAKPKRPPPPPPPKPLAPSAELVTVKRPVGRPVVDRGEFVPLPMLPDEELPTPDEVRQRIRDEIRGHPRGPNGRKPTVNASKD